MKNLKSNDHTNRTNKPKENRAVVVEGLEHYSFILVMLKVEGSNPGGGIFFALLILWISSRIIWSCPDKKLTSIFGQERHKVDMWLLREMDGSNLGSKYVAFEKE